MKKFGNPKKNKRKERQALIFAFALLIILILVFIAGFYFGKDGFLNKNKTGLKPQRDIQFSEGNPKDFEHTLVRSRTGEVIKKDDNAIFLEASYILNNKQVQATIKAEISPQTTIMRRDLYEMYKSSNITETTGAEVINFEDIKIGDKIIVRTDENIKYKTEFPVSSVEVQYSSQEF